MEFLTITDQQKQSIQTKLTQVLKNRSSIEAIDHMETLLTIAQSYFFLKQFDKAIHILSIAEKKDNLQEIFLALTALYLINNNMDLALKYIKKYISSNHSTFLIFKEEGLIQLIENLLSYSQALKEKAKQFIQDVYDLGFSLKMKNFQDLEEEGFHLILNNQYDEAVKILEFTKNGLKLPEKYPHLNNLSFKNWEKEYINVEEKLREKTKKIRNQKATSVDYMEIGKMYFLQENYTMAKNYFMKARDSFMAQKK